MEKQTDLDISINTLRDNTGEYCHPSETSIAELQQSDIVLLSGQFFGAGKSTIAKSLVREEGRKNIASWTNRELRPGEIEGVDKCHRTLEEMAEHAIAGNFLELEEVREGCFYATPLAFNEGNGYVKDLELKGAMRLRKYAPEIPVIVPLPPLEVLQNKQVTIWESRVVNDRGYDHMLPVKSIDDVGLRLRGVIDETDRIKELGLLNDSRTLFIVNDELLAATAAIKTFLTVGKRPEQTNLSDHLERMRNMAASALNSI